MSSNQNAKRKLINKYGKVCFLEELGIRKKEEVQEEIKKYKGKQRKLLDELTYHHIVERCKGGKATEENGALLRNINHQWFNRLPKDKQAVINKLFQEYKRQNYQECEVVFVDSLQLTTEIAPVELVIEERKREYNRAKQKEETRRLAEEYFDERD